MQYYDELLPLFLSKDDLRPALMQANEVDGSVYATDAHILFKACAERFINKYPPHEKVPNYSVLFGNKTLPPVQFTDVDLFNVLKNCQKCYDTKECETCKGEGEIECSYCMHSEKCEDCDGEGWMDDHSAPKIYDFHKSVVKIGDQYFNPELLGCIEKMIAKLCVDTFKIIMPDEKKTAALLLLIADVEVYLMPLTHNKQDPPKEKAIIELKIKETAAA